jgi:hypothetical protein
MNHEITDDSNHQPAESGLAADFWLRCRSALTTRQQTVMASYGAPLDP